MSTKFHPYFIFVFTFQLSININAQKIKLKNYSIGYRVFEIDAVGNNPTTISPLLKEPATYNNYLASIKYNSLFGNPQILHLHTFYINTEWHKPKPELRFWKKYSIQSGLLFTKKIAKWAGAVADERYSLPDNIRYVNKYSITQKLQFIGVNGGINRRFTLSKKLWFATGLHAQGSFALVHHFKQQWDSSTYTQSGGWKTNTLQLEDLKGKNFFQWQIVVPLALEYALYKNNFFIRVEADAGIVGSKYRPKSPSSREAHGAGIWFIYQPNATRNVH